MTMVESERDAGRATSDPAARREVLKRVEKENVRFIHLWFTDLEGHLKSFSITPAELEDALDDGMGFDGSSVTGFNRIEEIGHGRDPGSGDVPAHAERRHEGRADDLRHRHARREAVRRRPALRPQAGDRAHAVDGLRHLQRRPRARVLPLRGRQGHGSARRGRLLRDDRARRCLGAPQRDDHRARVDGHPDRVRPPRGRAVPARDRHALLERARHGRSHDHLPPGGQGDRQEGRLPRHLHAEAAVRRERLGHAHAHVALQRVEERVLRRRRRVEPLRGRQGVHRRAAPARARDLGRVRAVGQLVQAARPRLRGARSTSPGRAATARRSSASRSTSRARSRRPGRRSAAPTRPATRTSPSPRSSTRASRESRRATSCRLRWSRTSTT